MDPRTGLEKRLDDGTADASGSGRDQDAEASGRRSSGAGMLVGAHSRMVSLGAGEPTGSILDLGSQKINRWAAAPGSEARKP